MGGGERSACEPAGREDRQKRHSYDDRNRNSKVTERQADTHRRGRAQTEEEEAERGNKAVRRGRDGLP